MHVILISILVCALGGFQGRFDEFSRLGNWLGTAFFLQQMQITASFIAISALATIALAGPCADSRDPGCCLQQTSVTYPNGTKATEPLGFDANLNQVPTLISYITHYR
jgi:hypothetical protein